MLEDAAGATERRSPTYQVLVEDLKALGVEQVFGLMSDDTAVFATALDSSGIRFYGARATRTTHRHGRRLLLCHGWSRRGGDRTRPCHRERPARHHLCQPRRLARADHLRRCRGVGRRRQFDGPGLQGFQCRGRARRRRHPHLRRDQPRNRPRRRWPTPQPRRLQGGAAALLLPVNVQLADMDPRQSAAAAGAEATRPPAPPRPQAIEAAAAMLRQSRKPLIVAGPGRGIAPAPKAELEQLADRIGALLVTSARGKYMFRGHPLQSRDRRLVLAFPPPGA